jgi:hypothetical protein
LRICRVSRCGSSAARARLRGLIDRLNALVADAASPPREASPHEIVTEKLPAAAESAEEAEG